MQSLKDFRKVPGQSESISKAVKNINDFSNQVVLKIPWRRERLPTPVFWPGEFHGLHSPRGLEESNTTERLSLSLAPRGPLLRISHNIYVKPSIKRMHKTREM